jgi:hypothetical protein
MRLFSEEVKTTSSSSSLNILQVKDFSEIFFGVLEVEINEKKYPVEQVAKHGGNPVIMLPIMLEGVEKEYPFLLLKGKQEMFFNKENTEIPTADEEIIEESLQEIDKEKILADIEKLKKESIKKAQEEILRNKEILAEQANRERQKKEKILKQYLESARENLVDEFNVISQKIKNEIFIENDEKYSEIKDTIDNKILDITESFRQSLKKDFQNSSKIIDKSIRKLIKDLYEQNVNPRIDKELQEIASDIVEKVSDIDKNLNDKLKTKADVVLVEGVEKELNAIRNSNIELNDSINKGVQKALSRVGNVDKKILQISEKLDKKIEETEKEVILFFEDKLKNVKEETLDITDEARNYFHDLIKESRENLLTEIRKIKNEKPIEYVLETKNSGKIVKDWDSIEKDWNKKIDDKLNSVRTDLRKYVAVYASGGGTNATQYQAGGIIEGDLIITGNLSAANFSGGGGGGVSGDYLPLSGGLITGNLAVSGSVNTRALYTSSDSFPDYSKSTIYKDSLTVGSNTSPTFTLETDLSLSNCKFFITYTSQDKRSVVEAFVMRYNNTCQINVYSLIHSDNNNPLITDVSCELVANNLNIISNVSQDCRAIFNGIATYVDESVPVFTTEDMNYVFETEQGSGILFAQE